MGIEYHKDMIQGTDEWLKARLGRVTASNMSLLITPTGKVAKNDKVRKYAYEIAAQRETQCIEETYQSYDMARGHIQEDIARRIYSDSFADVEECGFITNDQFGGFLLGASPDGLVGDDGGIEIKSRLAKFQVETIINDEVPAEYMNQIQTSLLVSGRAWMDFVQYSNGMPLFVKRVLPDQMRINVILEAVRSFEEMVNQTMAEYAAKSAPLVKTERVEIMMDDEITVSGE